MNGRVSGKKVIVVGAGQQPGLNYGNGRAIATTFAKEGAEVFAVDMHEDRVASTVSELLELGVAAHPYVADVTKPDDCAAIIDSAKSTMGHIDVLVNNVGTNTGDTDALHLSEEMWDHMLATNLKSMWLTARNVIPHMRERGQGVITNISSTASEWGTHKFFSYGISKAGVNALAHALAHENASLGIRVNTVLPGRIDTPLGNESYVGGARANSREEIAARRAKGVPMGRQGTAWDVANAVLFLSSDEAAFITGVTLRVDGGAGTLVGSADW